MQSLNEAIFLCAFAAKVENYTEWHRQASRSVCPLVTTWALQKDALWNSISINPTRLGQKVSLNCVDFESFILPPITKFSFCVSAVALFFRAVPVTVETFIIWFPVTEVRVSALSQMSARRLRLSNAAVKVLLEPWQQTIIAQHWIGATGGISLTHLRIYRYESLNEGDMFREMRR